MADINDRVSQFPTPVRTPSAVEAAQSWMASMQKVAPNAGIVGDAEVAKQIAQQNAPVIAQAARNAAADTSADDLI